MLYLLCLTINLLPIRSKMHQNQSQRLKKNAWERTGGPLFLWNMKCCIYRLSSPSTSPIKNWVGIFAWNFLNTVDLYNIIYIVPQCNSVVIVRFSPQGSLGQKLPFFGNNLNLCFLCLWQLLPIFPNPCNCNPVCDPLSTYFNLLCVGIFQPQIQCFCFGVYHQRTIFKLVLWMSQC